MSLTSWSSLQVLLAADLNKIKDHLEGAVGSTLSWFLRCASGTNFLIRLSDNAGAQKFSIQDSDGAEVLALNSNGNLTIGGSFDPASSLPGILKFPTGSAPDPSIVNGRVIWDSDDFILAVGDGTTTQLLYPGQVPGDGDNGTHGASSTAATYTTLLTLNLTTTRVGGIAFHFSAGWTISNDAQTATMRAFLDDTTASGDITETNTAGTYLPANIAGLFTSVAAGAHTVKLQFTNGSASGSTSVRHPAGMAVATTA